MKKILLAILFLAITSNIAFGQSKKSCKLILFKGYIYVEAIFKNHPKPILFMLDTGTDKLLVNRDLVNEITLKKGDTLEFQLNNIPVKSTFSFPIDNFLSDSMARMYLGELLKDKLYGGIIGNSVFKDHYIIIDYPRSQLEVFASEDDLPIKLNETDIIYTDFVYDLQQIFVKASINKNTTGYFHLDTGIPTYNYLEFSTAKEAELSNLRKVSNFSNEIIEKFIYDNDGKPLSRVEQVVRKTNYDKPSYCISFSFGKIDLGKQYFQTMDIDLDKEVFSNAGVNPIVGSIAYESMKNYQIHINFIEQKMAFVIPNE